MTLSGFGNYPRHEAELSAPRGEAALREALRPGCAIARGNGRAYGDAALAPRTLEMRRFDRLLAFDEVTGLLVAEAGVLLCDLIDTFLPRGWFPPVTPGTKFVTLGGMVAADVHGKNHHKDGSFGNFVAWLDLLDADGRVLRCSPEENPELFGWTLGGMGLTGVILRLALRLRRVETAWIAQRTIPAPDLAGACAAFDEHAGASYSVAWIDALAGGRSLGRSLVMTGEHAREEQLPHSRRDAPFALPAGRRLTVPVDAPGWLLNGFSIRAFNALYYRAGKARGGAGMVDLDRFFYPLDAIHGWNRIYGKRGFVQFQCVLPVDSAHAGLSALLKATSAAGLGSFLAVLKRLGEAREGGMSFAMPGYTLALDFPATGATFALLDRLDAIAVDHGGRFYLAKDARMSAETLRRSDPRTETFAAMRAASGQAGRFASFQSQRLGL